MDQMVTYDAGCSCCRRQPGILILLLIHSQLAMELQQINTQYWIASFLNGRKPLLISEEAGFPLLTPNPYGQPSNPDVPNGTFIRRIDLPNI